MNKIDLGAVSAYALPKEKGYQGTEEEFATLMMQSGDNALRAEAAANRAEEILGSIPSEYTELSNQVGENTENVAALTKEMSYDHIQKLPVAYVAEGYHADSANRVVTQKRITADGTCVGANAMFTIADDLYTLAGISVGEYADIVEQHPRLRIWMYPRQDMNVGITFANSPHSWGSADGSIKQYATRNVDLTANEMAWVDMDYTDETVSDFYAVEGRKQTVGVILTLSGYQAGASNAAGSYELDVFVTDAEVNRDFRANHVGHAEVATYADKAEYASHASASDYSDTANEAGRAAAAVTGQKAVFAGVYVSKTPPLGESKIGGIRIQFAAGENDKSINVLSTQSLGKVADLKGKKLLVKCVNRNQDAATDIIAGWYLCYSNKYNQDWGNDVGHIDHLKNLANGGVQFFSINYSAFADTDDVYLRINNKGAYTAQTPYSLDVDLVVYVVPADYTNESGIVLATELVGFDPSDYVTRDEIDVSEPYITCWGDSLTHQGGWTTVLQEKSGMTVYNGGTGGENVHTISARQGADVMMLNNITIPADTTAVTLATRAEDKGITTEFGHKVTPLLQGNMGVNPVLIGDIEGTLKWTGSNYADTTGTWTFTRTTAGEAVTLKRPTALRTNYDRNRNTPLLMVIYMGQNGGYSDLDDLIRMHRLMIEHSHAKNVVVLGLSSGTATQRADYEAAMRKEFGRYFVSLREYLAHPIYGEDGSTIVSCYGLDDAGLTATEADLSAIATGAVPPQLLADTVHYTASTRTVIGNMLYKRCCELGIF